MQSFMTGVVMSNKKNLDLSGTRNLSGGYIDLHAFIIDEQGDVVR